MARYHNRSIDAIQVIKEMIDMAKDLQQQPEDGMSPEEVAFYDALAQNESARELMGNEELRVIAQELVNAVQANSSVDWWRKQNVRTKMRVIIRRILKKTRVSARFGVRCHQESRPTGGGSGPGIRVRPKPLRSAVFERRPSDAGSICRRYR